MEFQGTLESITGIFSSPFKGSAEILSRPAAPVKKHAGPVGSRLWHLRGRHSEGVPSGVRHAETGHVCDVWIGRTKRSNKGHNKAPCVPELLRQTPTDRAEGGEINTDSCYAQAASGIFDREDETRKEEREHRRRRGGEKSDEAHFEGQPCSLLLLNISLASLRPATLMFFLSVTFFG